MKCILFYPGFFLSFLMVCFFYAPVQASQSEEGVDHFELYKSFQAPPSLDKDISKGVTELGEQIQAHWKDSPEPLIETLVFAVQLKRKYLTARINSDIIEVAYTNFQKPAGSFGFLSEGFSKASVESAFVYFLQGTHWWERDASILKQFFLIWNDAKELQTGCYNEPIADVFKAHMIFQNLLAQSLEGDALKLAWSVLFKVVHATDWRLRKFQTPWAEQAICVQNQLPFGSWSGFVALESLEFSGCFRAGSSHFDFLKDLQIKILKVSNHQSLRLADVFGNLPETLEELSLHNNNIFDLSVLDSTMQRTSLKALDFSYNRILDATPLQIFTSLEVLSLFGNLVTSESVRHLLPNLQTLETTGCPIVGDPCRIFTSSLQDFPVDPMAQARRMLPEELESLKSEWVRPEDTFKVEHKRVLLGDDMEHSRRLLQAHIDCLKRWALEQTSFILDPAIFEAFQLAISCTQQFVETFLGPFSHLQISDTGEITFWDFGKLLNSQETVDVQCSEQNAGQKLVQLQHVGTGNLYRGKYENAGEITDITVQEFNLQIMKRDNSNDGVRIGGQSWDLFGPDDLQVEESIKRNALAPQAILYFPGDGFPRLVSLQKAYATLGLNNLNDNDGLKPLSNGTKVVEGPVELLGERTLKTLEGQTLQSIQESDILKAAFYVFGDAQSVREGIPISLGCRMNAEGKSGQELSLEDDLQDFPMVSVSPDEFESLSNVVSEIDQNPRKISNIDTKSFQMFVLTSLILGKFDFYYPGFKFHEGQIYYDPLGPQTGKRLNPLLFFRNLMTKPVEATVQEHFCSMMPLPAVLFFWANCKKRDNELRGFWVQSNQDKRYQPMRFAPGKFSDLYGRLLTIQECLRQETLPTLEDLFQELFPQVKTDYSEGVYSQSYNIAFAIAQVKEPEVSKSTKTLEEEFASFLTYVNVRKLPEEHKKLAGHLIVEHAWQKALESGPHLKVVKELFSGVAWHHDKIRKMIFVLNCKLEALRPLPGGLDVENGIKMSKDWLTRFEIQGIKITKSQYRVLVGGFKKLKTLRLEGAGLENGWGLNRLKNMEDLGEVYLPGNSITQLDFLGPSWKQLDLSRNTFTKDTQFQGLIVCTLLQMLNLSGNNHLQDLVFLRWLTVLKELYLEKALQDFPESDTPIQIGINTMELLDVRNNPDAKLTLKVKPTLQVFAHNSPLIQVQSIGQ